MGDDTLTAIDDAIKAGDTPAWGRAMLLAWRDDHAMLVGHLSWHATWGKAAAKIGVGVATALAVALAVWLAAGRLPAVFSP